MRVGYLVGGGLSLLLWKINRERVAWIFKNWLEGKVKDKMVVEGVCILFIIVVAAMVYLMPESEGFNGVIAFSILEMSKEVKDIKLRREKKMKGDRKVFYNILIALSKSLVGTFITPLMLIILFGNTVAVIYAMSYFLFNDESSNLRERILNVVFIIPSLITDVLLYFIYICRNKTFKIDFKGEFFQNLIYMPLLNIYILGAYIEMVNFYYIENYKVVHYLRSYGEYHGKIDGVAIGDLVTIMYGVAGGALIIFILLFNLKFKFNI